jgi:peptide/nickel transport system permease protein
MRLAAFTFLLFLICFATWSVATSPRRYAAQDRSSITAAPSRQHPAGTDELGRDRGSRIAMALILSLGGACAASVLASAGALALGVLCAFGPGWMSTLLLYLGDAFLTLPWLFLCMLVRSSLPLELAPFHSGLVTFALLGVLGAPAFLRLNHTRTAGLARADWLLHAYAAGLKPSQIGAQLWPHLRPMLWTQFLLYVPACLIAEANLGTMGLGLSQPLPSLGNFLADLQTTILLSNSHLIYLPVVILVAALVALEMTIFGVEQ